MERKNESCALAIFPLQRGIMADESDPVFLKMEGCNADLCTQFGYKLDSRLREFALRGQREPRGGIHAN